MPLKANSRQQAFAFFCYILLSVSSALYADPHPELGIFLVSRWNKSIIIVFGFVRHESLVHFLPRCIPVPCKANIVQHELAVLRHLSILVIRALSRDPFSEFAIVLVILRHIGISIVYVLVRKQSLVHCLPRGSIFSCRPGCLAGPRKANRIQQAFPFGRHLFLVEHFPLSIDPRSELGIF